MASTFYGCHFSVSNSPILNQKFFSTHTVLQGWGYNFILFYFFLKQCHVTETRVLVAILPTDAIKVPEMSLKAVVWTQRNPTVLQLSSTLILLGWDVKNQNVSSFWTLSVLEEKYNPPASKDQFLKESFFLLPIISSPWTPERWSFITSYEMFMKRRSGGSTRHRCHHICTILWRKLSSSSFILKHSRVKSKQCQLTPGR